MKVVQHTPNTLILRWVSHLPWFNAVGTILLGFLILSVGGQLTTLSCQRPTTAAAESDSTVDSAGINGHCTLTKRQALTSSTETISLENLEGAKVDTHQQGTQTARHRVLLVTPSQPIPLTPHFKTDYMSQQQHVEELEIFITDEGAAPLVIRDYGHSWVYVLGGMAIATGIITAAVGIERTTLTFDHTANCLQIHHQRLFNSWTDEYNLNTITNVEIGNPPTTIPQFNIQVQNIKKASLPCLNILFESGNRLPLSLNPKAEPIKEVVRDIRDFLQLSRNSKSS